MTLTPKLLYSGGQLNNSGATLYTCPPNTKTIIGTATFTNTDTANQTLTVYLVRSGGTASAANALIGPAFTLAPLQAYVSPELQGQILGAGDTIQAYSPSAANKITCAGISGLESTT